MVKRGFSLVEVIVAMTLLSIGLLGAAASGLVAARLQRESELQEEMVVRAASLIDSLALSGVEGAGTVTEARFTLKWTANAGRVTVDALVADTTRFTLGGGR